MIAGRLPSGMPIKAAALSSDRAYRWSLTRRWIDRRPEDPFIVIGLNPSTADEAQDDPTIRRCVGFAKREKCSGLIMLNLFAYRATSPKDMMRARNPVGAQNDKTIRDICEGRRVVCAWGAGGGWRDRDIDVLDMLDGVASEIACFGTTKDGHPKHPLYLRADTPLVPYTRRA